MVDCSVFNISVTDILRYSLASKLVLHGVYRGLTLRYTTVDVHCRDRTDECYRGIRGGYIDKPLLPASKQRDTWPTTQPITDLGLYRPTV